MLFEGSKAPLEVDVSHDLQEGEILHSKKKDALICMFFKIILSIFIFMCFSLCCTGTLSYELFSRYSDLGIPFIAVCGPLIVVASLVAEHGL